MSEERDQPVAEEERVSTEAEGVADEANAQGDDQPQLDEDGNPVEPEPSADDSEEIEHEGAKYKVPKALKEAFLRQADYTRKTQEVAAQRQELAARQAEIAQQAEAQAATLEQRVQLATVDKALQQYAELDWDEYAETYGDRAAIKAQGQWQQLKDARATLAQTISEKEAEHTSSSERAIANAIQEAEQILSKEVTGYGQELVGKVWSIGQSLGFAPTELRDSFLGENGKADVRTFKALAELAELRAFKAQHEAKDNKAKTVAKIAAVQPAKTVTPNPGQYGVGLDDNLPIDEWQRRRDAQLAKAARR